MSEKDMFQIMLEHLEVIDVVKFLPLWEFEFHRFFSLKNGKLHYLIYSALTYHITNARQQMNPAVLFYFIPIFSRCFFSFFLRWRHKPRDGRLSPSSRRREYRQRSPGECTRRRGQTSTAGKGRPLGSRVGVTSGGSCTVSCDMPRLCYDMTLGVRIRCLSGHQGVSSLFFCLRNRRYVSIALISADSICFSSRFFILIHFFFSSPEHEDRYIKLCLTFPKFRCRNFISRILFIKLAMKNYCTRVKKKTCL